MAKIPAHEQASPTTHSNCSLKRHWRCIARRARVVCVARGATRCISGLGGRGRQRRTVARPSGAGRADRRAARLAQVAAHGLGSCGKRLRQGKFDTAIDLQGLTKSAVAARLSGARRRIGIGGPDGREVSQWLNNSLVTPQRKHVIDRNLELLRPLGIERPNVRFDLESSAADIAAAHAILQHLGLHQFAMINPGAGWPSKIWPAERFAGVARGLGHSRTLKSLVVWAGSQEQQWAEQIVASSDGWALMAPATSLGELAALTRRATLFVSSDTGPLHLAVAVGTPSVGLFGPMPAERNGPYGSLHVSVQKMCLSGTSRERRSAGPESMKAISVEHVVAACERVLDRDKPAAA